MLTQGLVLVATVICVTSSSSPDDFLGKLTSTSTRAGASVNSVSLAEGLDNEGMASVTDALTIPSNDLTSSFTGTSSVKLSNSDSDTTAIGANTRDNVGINAAQLPAGAMPGGSDTGLTSSVATAADGTFLTQGSMASNGASQAGMGSGNLQGLSGATGSNGNTMTGSAFNSMGATQNHQTPSVGIPYLPAQTQQMGGSQHYGQGATNNMVPGSMQYMSAPGIAGQTQTVGNQAPSSTTNTGNTWGQRNVNPMQNNGIYPQGQYNQRSMYNNNPNPYHYNPYANSWGSYGYPAYNNQMYGGPGGYNPNSWHAHNAPPSPNPNANMINNHHNMNGGGNMAGRNGIAGPPPTFGGNNGGGHGGGYNNNPYNNNNMGAWQAAQTQSWLYPMFLFDLMF